ncbi:MAG: hypothetical protein WD004_08315 [Actinomycetota bacterium]
MTSIGGVTLAGGGGFQWDPEVGFISCGVGPGYVPVADGSMDTDDAFDGGLNLSVNGTFFDVPDASGGLSGQQLSVGPRSLAGLRVWRIDRVLGTSPTLRDLVKFRNPSSSAISVTIVLDTNLGANSATVVDSSTGDTTFTKADRWVLTDDEATDPTVTHVFNGKQAHEELVGVSEAPGGMSGNDCIRVRLKIQVPARSTRYLLFFLQMHDLTDQGAGYTASESDAAKFDVVRLNKKLLRGLSGKTKSKIVNWNLN